MFEALLQILLVTAICALLAWLAALLLRTRHSILGYIGAGLFGYELGRWIGTALKLDVPVVVANVNLVWAFVGAALVLLVFKFVPGGRR